MATGLIALKNLLNGETTQNRFQKILGANAPIFVESIIDLYNDPNISDRKSTRLNSSHQV